MKQKDIIIGLAITIILVVIDQLLKLWVISRFKEAGVVKAIPKIIDIQYVENSGAAFGIFAGRLWLFILITLAALAFFGYLAKDMDFKNHPFYSVGIVLIMSGTIGNFIDRIFRGYVVDYIQFAFWQSFATFNFADMCIVCGVTVMIISLILGEVKIE
ncbi:MAG TPA: signal peptidase II [Acholeplasma sp.]|jgi:signal peptidase II|nr:signal peptidase II [Acholeplasma sp.]